LLAAGCLTNRPGLETVHRGQPLLGTFVFITACGGSREQLNRAISEAFDEIQRIDAIMSLHRADSELARVNTSAYEHAQTVSTELLTVLRNALEIAKATDGAFDPTIAPLVQMWGFLWKEYRLPDERELREVLPLIDYRHVQLDTEARTVKFSRRGVTLDLNAIAKGYAVDCAIEKLREQGITRAMVRAGGDLRVIGAPPDADHWTVQLEDPQKRGKRRHIALRDAAISSSGNYENYFEVGGQRYSHILNPRTGMPVQGIAACTVVAPTCMESDAWATALFICGPERSMAQFSTRVRFEFALDDGRLFRTANFTPK